MAECREILNERNGQDEDAQLEANGEESVSGENETENFPTRVPKLSATDDPTERLLMKIAQHVVYNKANLLIIATDVRMAEGIFTQKTAQYSEPKTKIFQVLCSFDFSLQNKVEDLTPLNDCV